MRYFIWFDETTYAPMSASVRLKAAMGDLPVPQAVFLSWALKNLRLVAPSVS